MNNSKGLIPMVDYTKLPEGWELSDWRKPTFDHNGEPKDFWLATHSGGELESYKNKYYPIQCKYRDLSEDVLGGKRWIVVKKVIPNTILENGVIFDKDSRVFKSTISERIIMFSKRYPKGICLTKGLEFGNPPYVLEYDGTDALNDIINNTYFKEVL